MLKNIIMPLAITAKGIQSVLNNHENVNHCWGDEMLCHLQQLLPYAVISFNDARPVLLARSALSAGILA